MVLKWYGGGLVFPDHSLPTVEAPPIIPCLHQKIITSKGKRHVQNFSDLIFPFRFTISLVARKQMRSRPWLGVCTCGRLSLLATIYLFRWGSLPEGNINGSIPNAECVPRGAYDAPEVFWGFMDPIRIKIYILYIWFLVEYIFAVVMNLVNFHTIFTLQEG